MNKLIKKFWIDQGFEVRSDYGFPISLYGKINNCHRQWIIFSNTLNIFQIIAEGFGTPRFYQNKYHVKHIRASTYYFQNKKYSEAKMLKLINLKIFL